jgi:hypothetical protein
VRALRDSPAVLLVLVLVCLGAVPSVVWLVHSELGTRPQARARDFRYASQLGTRTATRRAQLQQRGDEDVDAALETCGGLGVRRLAARYGVEPRPEIVARRFSLSLAAGYRSQAYEGCLKGLSGGG